MSLSTVVSFWAAGAEEVNIYSARKEALIKPLLDRFTQQTGIEVNLVTGKADALLSRLASEGEFSPADLIITTDAGRLVRAKQQGLTQAFNTSFLHSQVAGQYRDAENHWIGLTLRARPIMYAPERVDIGRLQGMADLTKPEWKKRICIRSSSNIYNQSMLAAMLVGKGEKATADWSKGVVANFARTPKGGDRDQIKAVVAGQCDIAIANTYYLAGMLADKKQNPIARQVKVFWPDQNGSGAHVNISGAAITRHAPNANNAQKLLEFMLGKKAQQWYAESNHEYPIRMGIEHSEILKSFGDFKVEQVSMQKIGELNGKALEIMDKAGWR